MWLPHLDSSAEGTVTVSCMYTYLESNTRHQEQVISMLVDMTLKIGALQAQVVDLSSRLLKIEEQQHAIYQLVEDNQHKESSSTPSLVAGIGYYILLII